jgi:hypothetical protein
MNINDGAVGLLKSQKKSWGLVHLCIFKHPFLGIQSFVYVFRSSFALFSLL